MREYKNCYLMKVKETGLPFDCTLSDVYYACEHFSNSGSEFFVSDDISNDNKEIHNIVLVGYKLPDVIAIKNVIDGYDMKKLDMVTTFDLIDAFGIVMELPA